MLIENNEFDIIIIIKVIDTIYSVRQINRVQDYVKNSYMFTFLTFHCDKLMNSS